MYITKAVGKGSGNRNKGDIKVVQVMLNENLVRIGGPLRPLPIDGNRGVLLEERITLFQQNVLHSPHPDGRVDPVGATIRALRAGLNRSLTKEKMLAIMPDTTPELVDKYFDLMTTMMASDYVEINTPLRKAHYLAQVGTETGDLQSMEEKSSGKQYEDNDNLGNTEKGDGIRFKGRGMLQMTGRWNYTAYGKHVGKDYITDPTSLLVASDDSVAVDSSGWYWHLRHGNKYADADDVVKVTHKVNGGDNGIADRKKHLQRAKCLLVF